MKKISVIILLISLFITGCFFTKSQSRSIKEESKEVFNFTDEIDEYINVDVYSIYGRFFNITGILNEEKEYKLVLKNNENEKEYDIYLEKKDNKIVYKTNKLINEGIDLENIEVGTYIVLLKNNDTYYNLKNKSTYENLEYYTITNNKKNKKITIEFTKIFEKDYLVLTCTETKLPNDIYDIIIDPGHGGRDIGASNKEYTESKFNLEYALLLKEKLENLGLKVKLTREKDISIDNYGKNGRISFPYKTKAKLMLSLHLNSAKLNVGAGGVEIYVPNHTNTTFAKTIAKNIVDATGTIYSKNSSACVQDGVYMRTLSKSDLEEIKKDALKNGYTPYEKATTYSTYYYMIRETGGIITNSYIDGRDPKKDGNPYYDSNHGCESYLIELGYISSSTNLDLLINKKEEYIKAIVDSFKQELSIK